VYQKHPEGVCVGKMKGGDYTFKKMGLVDGEKWLKNEAWRWITKKW